MLFLFSFFLESLLFIFYLWEFCDNMSWGSVGWVNSDWWPLAFLYLDIIPFVSRHRKFYYYFFECTLPFWSPSWVPITRTLFLLPLCQSFQKDKYSRSDHKWNLKKLISEKSLVEWWLPVAGESVEKEGTGKVGSMGIKK